MEKDIVMYYEKIAQYAEALKKAGKESNLSDEYIEEDVLEKQKTFKENNVSFADRINMLTAVKENLVCIVDRSDSGKQRIK